MTRKLDALVAERVMDAKRITQSRYKDHSGYSEKFVTFENGEGEVRKPLPHYSTDIAAAWQVVDKLGSMDMDHTAPELGIVVRFYEFSKREPAGKADEATVPLAISIAALRAVGVDEAEIQEALQ